MSASTPELTIDERERVMWVRINREAQANALSPEAMRAITDAARHAATSAEVRALVITGVGERVFCSGGDLRAFAGSGGPAGIESACATYCDMLSALLACTKPTIARIAGHALGGGVGLVLACDFALAADDVYFSLPEASRGLFPMMVSALLLRAVPRKRALEMMFTGVRTGAGDAAAIALITRACPRADLDGRVSELLATLARQSPQALALGKSALSASEAMPLQTALAHLRAQLVANLGAADAAEGLSAFAEKRPPRWSVAAT